MATHEAAAAAGEAAETSYGGGVGGKFRGKRLHRGRTSTPYDRPPTALRNPNTNANGRSGWISRLVDPASRIIATSATKLFSSMFRKRLTALPSDSPPSDANPEPRSVLPEENPSGVRESDSKGENANKNHESNVISELEQLLKQKTFTRVEFEHLTELLRSRTVESSADVECKTTDPTMSQMVLPHKGQENAAMSAQANGVWNNRLFGSVSTPAVGLSIGQQVRQEDASPTELAKAYMGTRPSKVSPSTLGFRNQTSREDQSAFNTAPFVPKLRNVPIAPRSAGRYSGVGGLSENGYVTPKPDVRLAMYSMARTPYSRVRSAATSRVKELSEDGYIGSSSSSQWTRANRTLVGANQALKRRSSVLDNDFGSGGPILRIRQKFNMMSPPKDHGSISSIQKPLLLDGPKHSTSIPVAAENRDDSISKSKFPAVPPQSSEMARQILQQLDKLVPSPKGKSPELMLAVAREKSPAKLTLNMLNGQALRSMDKIESPKWQNERETGTSNGTPAGLGGTHLPDPKNFVFQQEVSVNKEGGVRENGPMKAADEGVKLASEADAVRSVVIPDKNVVFSVKPADSVVSGCAANPPRIKRAFQMSVPEDSVDLDDDHYNSKDASTVHSAEKEKLQPSVAEHKAGVTEKLAIEKPLVSAAESTPAVSFAVKKGVTVTGGISDVTAATIKDAGFTFPSSSPPSAGSLPPILTSQSPSLFNGPVLPQDQSAAPVCSFGSKTVDKGATVFTFSSTTSDVNNVSALKSDAKLDSKPEISSSNTSAVVASLVVRGSDNDVETQKDGEIPRSFQNVVSSGTSTSTTPSFLSFNASGSSNLSNGSLTSTSSDFKVSVAPSAPLSGSTLLSSIASSSTITTTISSSITATSSTSASSSISAASPTSVGPMFKFGSSTQAAVPPVSVSQLSTPSGIEYADSEPKTKQVSLFDTSGSSLSTSSPAFATTGNGIFGFNTTSSSGSINSLPASSGQLQSPAPFGSSSATGSLFGSTQAAPSTSSVSTFTQSMPSQFGSSASSPSLGSSQLAFSFGSSPFGSSAPAAKPFGSSSRFGLASSSLSTSAGSFSSSSSFPTSGSTSSLFGSSSQPATSSILGSVFSSSSSQPATGFSFGASAASPAAVGNTPMAFGSSFGASTGSMFSFPSSASAAASLSTFNASQPAFGMLNSAVGFGSASPGNDQMNVEDSMAEDTVQQASSIPVAPSGFVQPNFSFGSPANPSVGPFQFGSQQNPTAMQTPSPFTGPGNIEFAAGGSFSVGSGGGEKSNRRFIRAKRDKPRKK